MERAVGVICESVCAAAYALGYRSQIVAVSASGFVHVDAHGYAVQALFRSLSYPLTNAIEICTPRVAVKESLWVPFAHGEIAGASA